MTHVDARQRATTYVSAVVAANYRVGNNHVFNLHMTSWSANFWSKPSRCKFMPKCTEIRLTGSARTRWKTYWSSRRLPAAVVLVYLCWCVNTVDYNIMKKQDIMTLMCVSRDVHRERGWRCVRTPARL